MNQSPNGQHGSGGGYNVFLHPQVQQVMWDYADIGIETLPFVDNVGAWMDGDSIQLQVLLWLEDNHCGPWGDWIGVTLDAVDLWGNHFGASLVWGSGLVGQQCYIGWTGIFNFGPYKLACPPPAPPPAIPFNCNGVWQDAWTITWTIEMRYFNCGVATPPNPPNMCIDWVNDNPNIRYDEYTPPPVQL